MTSAILGISKEVRSTAGTFRSELGAHSAGLISVSGVLAEQLVRELGEGARPGVVRTGGDTPPASADALVRVIAGDPTDADLAFVRAADRRGTPVVLVQLWPQADWTLPFVLSPYVVECRAGAGFPVKELADRIADATEQSAQLASSVPALRPSVERKLVLRSVVRAAAFGAFARRLPTRPLITNEQVRLVARLNAAKPGGGVGIADEPAALAAVTGAILASGYAFRSIARTTRFVLPPALVNAAVAAGGTWALAKAAKVHAARSSA
jgi:hypothetical protein